MKTLLIAVTLATLSGCAYRDAKMFSDDTKKVLEPKNPDIKACYDGVLKTTPTAAGKVTVTFEVETDKGKIINVAVDKANTTAPDSVAECVTKNISDLALTPPDSKLGKGSATYEFAPNKS